MSFNKHKIFLYLTSFLEGGALMSLEILATKIIAPYYGVSLYVWSAVLATTLGGIATGYFIGGKLSLKNNNLKILSSVVFLSSFFIILLPGISDYLLSATLHFDIRSGITISCFFILYIPMSLFGMVSPLVISELNKHYKNPGFASGKIYTLSTVSGILFTFICGFYLIPVLGLKNSLYITGLTLAIVQLVYLLGRNSFLKFLE